MELKWQLEDIEQNLRRDPGYPIALGTLYNYVRDRYPFQEQLPINDIPSELVPQMVRFRFRPGGNRYPLLQLGPGIAAINFIADGYSWREFRTQAEYLIDNLQKAYEDANYELQPESVALRYSNLFRFDDYGGAMEFVAEKFRSEIVLPLNVDADPINFDINLNYALEEPSNAIGALRIATASQQDSSAMGDNIVVLNLTVASQTDYAPQFDDNLLQWLDSAHDVVHNWFFAFVTGDLLARYQGE